MTDQNINKDRRRVIKLAVGGMAAIPLSSLVLSQRVVAADLPHLAADNPQAGALKYVEDATKAARIDKGGVAADQQVCSNCQLAQTTEGDWLPCQLFPGKSVAAKGWCSAWAPRPPA